MSLEDISDEEDTEFVEEDWLQRCSMDKHSEDDMMKEIQNVRKALDNRARSRNFSDLSMLTDRVRLTENLGEPQISWPCTLPPEMVS